MNIGKRSLVEEVERIPNQGLNAINSCPTSAILKQNMFLKTIYEKNTIPVPLRIETIFVANRPSVKTYSSTAKRTGPPGPAFGNETFSPTPAMICRPAER